MKKKDSEWIAKVKSSLDADRDAENLAEGFRVKPFVKYEYGKDNRGAAVYQLFCIYGISEKNIGKVLGIGQPAVSVRLTKFFEKYPELKPEKPEN